VLGVALGAVAGAGVMGWYSRWHAPSPAAIVSPDKPPVAPPTVPVIRAPSPSPSPVAQPARPVPSPTPAAQPARPVPSPTPAVTPPDPNAPTDDASEDEDTPPEQMGSRPLSPMGIRKGRTVVNRKYGFVAINTEPWTMVRIEGQMRGATPLREVKLPIGPHKVTFENRDLSLRLTVKLDVKENKHTQYRFQLTKAKKGWIVARQLKL
jgi:hypothetical protein